ncbi:unnamed protein product [Caenorhabditis bovis]|uniref:SXP/RAL-2 family protein Ani s 5-like cation-binding domain-containing protein n=1 Tax=Caenorhabditis bovis TaxID=2654633 RepID=A0A8S1EZZ5_9PELO|nr:unnamed protein product [Caenorhabditis bovis]
MLRYLLLFHFAIAAPLASTTIPSTIATRVIPLANSIETKLPFLRGVDDLNKEEFFEIIRDEKLSKAEIWKHVEEWSKKQPEDVQMSVIEFHQKLSEHVDSSKMRVQNIVRSLPEALHRLRQIVEDVEITRLQEKNRIANLYSSLEEDVSKTLQFIVNMVSFENNEGKIIEQKHKIARLKKGGIWTGNSHATTIF